LSGTGTTGIAAIGIALTIAALLDHLVGGRQQRFRDGEAEGHSMGTGPRRIETSAAAAWKPSGIASGDSSSE
jgi:hypothetical protein